MLSTKFESHQTPGFEKEDFEMVYTIYGHGGLLGDMTKII